MGRNRPVPGEAPGIGVRLANIPGYNRIRGHVERKLLSILLKPFLGKNRGVSARSELHPDTEMSLSLIDSGCLFAQIGGKAALIIKGKVDEFDIIKEFQTITIDFELIEKAEFPSLAFFLNIVAKCGRKFRFEYFFSTESGDETEILRMMCGDRRFDIILYSSGVDLVIRAEIPEGQAAELGTLLGKAGG